MERIQSFIKNGQKKNRRSNCHQVINYHDLNQNGKNKIDIRNVSHTKPRDLPRQSSHKIINPYMNSYMPTMVNVSSSKVIPARGYTPFHSNSTHSMPYRVPSQSNLPVYLNSSHQQSFSYNSQPSIHIKYAVPQENNNRIFENSNSPTVSVRVSTI